MPMEYIPGLAGVPAAKSAISFVDGNKGILEYRGYPIQDLAEKSTFDETAYLLLFGDLPSKSEFETFEADLRKHRVVKFHVVDMIKSLPDNGHPMDVLQASVTALGMLYPSRDVADPQVRRDTAVRLIAKVPTLIAIFHRIREGNDPIAPRDDLSHAANFLYMLSGKEPDRVASRVLDACLVLHADHTMNASTFTARVIASTMADGFSVISGAAGSLSGPLHGGANEAVLDLLDEIGDPANARKAIEDRLAAKKKIMGLGHRVYKVKDPRAYILQHLAEQLFDRLGTSRYYEIAREVEKAALELLGDKGIYPNVDFYSGIVYDRLGFPRDLFTPIFAASRTAGWCAHWLEQMEDNRIFRPRQIYGGKHDRIYVALNKRA